MRLRNKPESPIVRIALQFAEQAERLPVIAPRVEQNQRCLPHDGMQVIEQRMRTQKGPDAADTRNQYQVALFGLGDFGEDRGQFVFVEWAFERGTEGWISFLALKLEGFVQQIPI